MNSTTPRFIIFGASGDLTARYLFPAIVELHSMERLPTGLRVVGIGKDDWDNGQFRRYLGERLRAHAPELNERSRDAVLRTTEYAIADVTDAQALASALGTLVEPVSVYLALPPALFHRTIEGLLLARLPEGSVLVIEKPFGLDLDSARELNGLIHQAFQETAVFRIDHFLGEQTVLNILGLRSANRVFEPLWNNQHLDRVEIIWDEMLTMEGRAAYDGMGALKDLLQNHLLQLLCLVCMELPSAFSGEEFRSRKVEFLRAIRTPSATDAVRETVRARYTKGRAGRREVPSYVDEPGVDPSRGTETLAEVTLHADNWRWEGVPFVLRTGKALGQDRKEIAVFFKSVPRSSSPQETALKTNVLRLHLDPDRISLGVNVNSAADKFSPHWIELGTPLAPQVLRPYARLISDVLLGDQTFSIRADEAEEAWRIMDPIALAWRQGQPPLLEYPAGSEGPDRSLVTRNHA